MFGLRRKKPEPCLDPARPIELKTAIEIDRPAADVYALLDFDDPRNQMRARGNAVRRIADNPREFRMWYDRTPNLNFLFTVTEAIPGRAYSYAAKVVPPVGRRLNQHEAYAIEPLDERSCRLTFVNAIEHVPGLTEADLAEEVGLSMQAMLNALAKLKLQAEQGVPAVEAFERELGQR
jgi:hypothetical protein